MQDTVFVQVRWPRSLAGELKALAERRHTTMSAIVRQSVIDRYGIGAPPPSVAGDSHEDGAEVA